MYRRLIILAVLLITAVLSAVSFSTRDLNEEKYIDVEIRGAVDKPGVYQMRLGSTFEDLIRQAGLNEDSYIEDHALGDVLCNDELIVIRQSPEEELISINSSDIEELSRLPGIGPSLAEKIIEYREHIGSFKRLEDIMNVKGIGNGKFAKIREYICL